MEEGLRLRRQNGDRALECAALCSLALLALWQGDDTRALTLAHSALNTAVAVQARDWEAVASIRLGAAEAALGRLEPAKQAYTRARRVAQDIGEGRQFDASADLASLAWAQGDIDGALREVNALLTRAKAGAPGDAVGGPGEDRGPFANGAREAAAGNFGGADTPRLIELTVYRVFAAAGDPRAAVWLQRAHTALMSQAEAISDPALRQMFLTNIPHHREIVALWRAR